MKLARLAALWTLCTVCMLCLGQAPSMKAAEAPKEKIPVAAAPKEALRVAIHKHDQAEKQIADINLQFLQVQANAKAQMDKAQAAEKEAAEEIEKAEQEAFKTAGLDQNHYALDRELMEFTSKTQAPKAPTPTEAARQ